MMPATHNNMRPMECVSALQKSIRRSNEHEAMQFACELLHTSKAYFTMLCNRLEIIVHEDIDTLADLTLVSFVGACLASAKAHYEHKTPGEARLIIGNLIRALCRAPKSRAGCHFAAAIGLGNVLEQTAPTIPDYALDVHTQRGKAQGRGLAHFRAEGAKLVQPKPPGTHSSPARATGPVGPDPYEAEAYRLWAIKYGEAK